MRDALYACKIISYAQGLVSSATAGEMNNWDLNFGDIAAIWRGGCIIRARFLNRITEAYRSNPGLEEPDARSVLQRHPQQDAGELARRRFSTAIEHGIAVPAFSAALGYYDSYRAERLPANLLQAQRDYFGAHTYERIDKPAGQFFHTEWFS